MKIKIETPQDALECSQALLLWIEATLSATGFIKPVINEAPYYTHRRALAEQLKTFTKDASR